MLSFSGKVGGWRLLGRKSYKKGCGFDLSFSRRSKESWIRVIV